MRVLFICNQNKDRSPTAEEMFKDRFETRSSGLYCQEPVTSDQIAWADMIIVMEENQREELAKRFPKLFLQKRVLCMDIPDIYVYQQKELQEQLQEKIKVIDEAIEAAA